MSSSNGIDVEELDFPTTSNYSHVSERVVDTTDRNTKYGLGAPNCGETCPLASNENDYYDEPGSLFNQQLILPKELKSSFDIRYKTDYFPRGGKNAGIPQPPRYLHTVDDEHEIIIKFPDGYKIPQNPGNYLLEVALLTVPRINQHYMHVNKFQLNHTDFNALDENPFLIRLTLENFQKGEVRVKLVITKTLHRDLQNIASLPLFGDQTPSGWTADCKSVEDLQTTYELTHARVAFSLGYENTNGQFIRFTNTTVVSNEIIEKDKSKPDDNVTCPNCAHSFSVREQKEKGKKRSASSSNSMKKKRPS